MLKFAGERAVGLGASDKELAALPVLTNEQIRALTIRASAIHRSSRDEVNAAAKRITAGRNAAALGIPNPLDLATFVPPDTVWVVDGLIPQGGCLGLFAERKPGKTTTMVELSRALLTVMRFSAGSTPDCRLMLDWSGTARSAGSIVATGSSQGTSEPRTCTGLTLGTPAT